MFRRVILCFLIFQILNGVDNQELLSFEESENFKIPKETELIEHNSKLAQTRPKCRSPFCLYMYIGYDQIAPGLSVQVGLSYQNSYWLIRSKGIDINAVYPRQRCLRLGDSGGLICLTLNKIGNMFMVGDVYYNSVLIITDHKRIYPIEPFGG